MVVELLGRRLRLRPSGCSATSPNAEMRRRYRLSCKRSDRDSDLGDVEERDEALTLQDGRSARAAVGPVVFAGASQLSKKNGAPWGIRTSDLQIRSLSLYPAELRARHAVGERTILTTPSGGVKRAHVAESPLEGPCRKQMFWVAAAFALGVSASAQLEQLVVELFVDDLEPVHCLLPRPRFPTRAARRDGRALASGPTFLFRCDPTVAGGRHGRCQPPHHGSPTQTSIGSGRRARERACSSRSAIVITVCGTDPEWLR